MAVAVEAEQDFGAMLAEGFLDVRCVVDRASAGQGLMAKYQKRFRRFHEFGLEPGLLFGADVGRIAALVSGRPGVVTIQDEDLNVAEILSVVTTLDAPGLVAVFSFESEIELVIADDVDGLVVGGIETIRESLVFPIWVGEVA